MDNKAAIGITVFNSPPRLRLLLEKMALQGWPEAPVRVTEDPWKLPVQPAYEAICEDYSIPFARLPAWGCMQRAANLSVERNPEPWWIFIPDDVLPSPGAIANALYWCNHLDDSNVGLFQLPYWNADELFEVGRKDRLWNPACAEWLHDVPLNPHWGELKPYVNVNGAGFAMRRAVWEQTGGFSPETWSFDEDIAAKCWLRTSYTIAAVPGPPLVHYMGASLSHPNHCYHCAACWKRAGWADKSVLDVEIRAVMAKRPLEVRRFDDAKILSA